MRHLALQGLEVVNSYWESPPAIVRFRWARLSLRLKLSGEGPGTVSLGKGLTSRSGGVLSSPLELQIRAGKSATWHVAVGGAPVPIGPNHVIRGPLSFEVVFDKDMLRESVEGNLRSAALGGDPPAGEGELRFAWTGDRRVLVDLTRLNWCLHLNLAGALDSEGVRVQDSYDRRYALSATDGVELRAVDVASSGSAVGGSIIAGPLPFAFSGSASPDGTRLALHECFGFEGESGPDSFLWMCDTATGKLARVTPEPGGTMAWQPDSQAFFVGPSGLARYSRDGVLMEPHPGLAALAYAVSPDGSLVACVAPSKESDGKALDVHLWDPDKKSVTLVARSFMPALTEDSYFRVPLIRWETGGARLLVWYDRYDKSTPLHAVSVELDAGKVTSLPDEPAIEWPSPDGRVRVTVGAYTTGGNRELCLHRADGKVVTLPDLWYTHQPWQYAVVWHPSGKVFAAGGYAYNDAGEQVADLSGGAGTGRFLGWLPGDSPRALIAQPLR